MFGVWATLPLVQIKDQRKGQQKNKVEWKQRKGSNLDLKKKQTKKTLTK